MNDQLELDLGQRHKRKALDHLETVAAGYLREARAYAKRHCQVMGSVTIDDVLEAVGMPPEGISHNAVGAIFSNGEFYVLGWTTSRRPSNHGRSIHRWALRRRNDSGY